ncbi:hypothetical protein ABT143_03355 [Streptomyces sp. NPDC002033]|uniref:hypothetical protein n=1 Tax=unclassified Streptomyces TaxID=2593676 RepID=UPI003332A935
MNRISRAAVLGVLTVLCALPVLLPGDAAPEVAPEVTAAAPAAVVHEEGHEALPAPRNWAWD